MTPSLTALPGKLSGLHARRALAPPADPSEFWETTRVAPGRGYSCMTYAYTERLNAVRVLMQHYSPGPFDHVAYGVDAPQAIPRSTYYVYTGVAGHPDVPQEQSCLKAIKALHPNVDLEALACGEFGVHSPDGEGSLYIEFAEEDLDAAFAFADSLEPEIVEAAHEAAVAVP